MIEIFISTLPLFAASYLSCLLSASMLAISGFVLVGKKQEFLGASMSQASMLGIGIVVIFDWINAQYLTYVTSILLACLTSFWVYNKSGNSYASSVTAYLFIFFSAAVMVMIAMSPHGMEEVKVLSSASLIGSSWSEVYWMTAMNIFVITLFWRYRRQIFLYLVDPQFLSTCRINFNRFNYGVALLLGIVIGTCLKVSGFLFTFGYLILPVLCAKNLSNRYFRIPWLAVIIAVIFGMLGINFSIIFDLPPGATCVLLLSLAVPITITIRNILKA